MTEPNIAFIRNTNDLSPYLPALLQAKTLAIDLETTGLDPHMHRIRLIQLAAEGIPTLVIDAPTFLTEDGKHLLHKILSTPAVKVFQNAKFDLQFLMTMNLCPAPLFDTMLAGRLLYRPGMPHRANLETLANVYLNEQLDKQEQKGDWEAESLTPAQVAYAAKDAEILPRLRKVMIPQLMDADMKEIAEIEFA